MKNRIKGKFQKAKTADGPTIHAEVEYPASPEEIWELLTTRDGLERWFPQRAHVEPGEGGVVGITWTDRFTWVDRIVEWEPGKKLVLKPHGNTDGMELDGIPVKEDLNPLPYTMEFTLEGKGGNTTLRLVQSGFLQKDNWEDDYDSYFYGWRHQFTSLHHYLVKHRGQKRRFYRISTMSELPPEECWDRVVSASGLLRIDTEAGIGTFHVPGFEAGGSLLQFDSPDQMNLELAEWNDSLLGFGVWRYPEKRWVVSEVNYYGDQEAGDRFAAEYQKKLNALFQ